jgi:hypothetical protein
VREQLEQYIKQVREWHEECRGNEQATKASLIAPLFTMLGYNLTDPRECKPEYRMDFGKGEKSATPVDWAFLINGAFAFFVEAKKAGDNISKYPEQLRMYFGKQPGANGVKLGILTNGTQWHFFTDLRFENAMDTEPFFAWDVLQDDPGLVVGLLKLLQRADFTAQRIRAFAEARHHKSVLVGVLGQLLEPSNDFVKLALSTPVNNAGDTLVTGKIKEKLIDQWKPILKDAIHEWAKQHDLNVALQRPHTGMAFETAASVKEHAGTGALADLIALGVLMPPLKLFRKYKGQMVEAELQPDGHVFFQGVSYASCSQAGEVARASVTGQKMNTNGWTFWQYRDAAGKRLCLDDARKHLSGTKRHPTEPLVREKPERYGLRKRFWEALLACPKVKNTRHANIAPGEFRWIGAGSGVRGLPFIYAVGQDEGRVELYIDRGADQRDANKRVFSRLQGQRKEIEGTFGGQLDWQRLDDKRACRIAYTITLGGYRSEESKWPEIHDAMIDAMARLEKALTPQLAKLKTELASEA